ncbi:MAG: hypothetical protein Q9170_002152 [Blastenia crenularia]
MASTPDFAGRMEKASQPANELQATPSRYRRVRLPISDAAVQNSPTAIGFSRTSEVRDKSNKTGDASMACPNYENWLPNDIVKEYNKVQIGQSAPMTNTRAIYVDELSDEERNAHLLCHEGMMETLFVQRAEMGQAARKRTMSRVSLSRGRKESLRQFYQARLARDTRVVEEINKELRNLHAKGPAANDKEVKLGAKEETVQEKALEDEKAADDDWDMMDDMDMDVVEDPFVMVI